MRSRCLRPSQPPSPIGHSDLSPGTTRGASSAHQVLVVEDEPAVLDATRLLLIAVGYGVATATSVAQAIERARESRDLKLGITDHRLGDGETGRQVIASVRGTFLGPTSRRS